MFGFKKLKEEIGWAYSSDPFYNYDTLWGRIKYEARRLDDFIKDRCTLSDTEFVAFKQIMRERFKCHVCLDGMLSEGCGGFCKICGTKITGQPFNFSTGDSMAKKKSIKKGGMKKGGC